MRLATNYDGNVIDKSTLDYVAPSFLNLLLFAGCYAAFAAVGKSFALDVDQQGVFWPPSGLYVAILLLSEPRHWWRWVLAAGPAEVVIGISAYHYPLLASSSIFLGNTLEATTGAYLVRWFCGTPFQFQTVRNVLAFIYLAVALSPICSATVGTLTLSSVGIPTFGKVWFGWWSGDALGVLVVAPLVLLLLGRRISWRDYDRWQYLEAVMLIATTIASAHIIFSSSLPILYFIVLTLLWAALRFGLAGAAVAMLVVSYMTVSYTAAGAGLFASSAYEPDTRIVLVHLFLSVASIFTLVVGANAQQQQVDHNRLQQAWSALNESEDRLRRVIGASPIAIAIGGSDGQITSGNDAFHRLIGYGRDEVMRDGIDWDWLTGPEYGEIDRQMMEQPQSTDTVGPYEKEYVRRDGTRVPALVSVARLPDRDEYVAFILDVSERKRIASIAREKEERLRLVAEASHMYSWEIDMSSRSMEWSANATRILGHEVLPEDADAALKMVHPEDQDMADAIVEKHVQTGGPFSFECRLITKKGELLWLLSQCTTITDTHGVPLRLLGITQDITARKTAESALRDLNATLEQRVASQIREIRLLAKALSHLTEGVIITDANLDVPGPRIEYVNEAMCRISGYSEAELIGQTPRLFQGATTDRQVLEQLKSELAKGNSFSCELINYHKDGTPFDTELFITPLFDGQKQPTKFVSVQRDITQRKLAQRALFESEARMRSIVDTASDAIITIDNDGIITSANEATQHMFGYEARELLGQNVNLLMPAPYHDEHDNYLQSYLHTRQPKVIGIGREVNGRRKDGSLIPIDLAVSEIRGGGFTGILRDTTDRKQLQQHVLEIAASEQRRIGQELHDGIQQELTGLSLFAGALNEMLASADKSDSHDSSVSFDGAQFSTLRETAQKLTYFLSQTHRHVQQLSHGIMPVQIEADGLQTALRDLVLANNGLPSVSCQFHCPRPILVDNNTTATHLFRIAQEALNNALRHSRARQIDLYLTKLDEHQISLEICDDGVGIEPCHGDSDQSQTGIGLRTMDYRARIIGGWLQIERRSNGGTVVRCVIPDARGVPKAT